MDKKSVLSLGVIVIAVIAVGISSWMMRPDPELKALAQKVEKEQAAKAEGNRKSAEWMQKRIDATGHGVRKITNIRPDPKQKQAQELDHLTQELTLTDAQKTQVKAILEADTPRIQAVFEDQEQPVEQKSEKVRQIRQEMDGKIKAALTPEQQTKFDAMQKKPEPKAATNETPKVGGTPKASATPKAGG